MNTSVYWMIFLAQAGPHVSHARLAHLLVSVTLQLYAGRTRSLLQKKGSASIEMTNLD